MTEPNKPRGFRAIVTEYRQRGHVSVDAVFETVRMQAAIADAMAWVDERRRTISGAEAEKIIEGGNPTTGLPRWIDHPVRYQPVFDAIARHPPLVALVESLIGPGVDVYFSQIFFKPPREGSPKPAHQDNFYAGPNDPDGLVTAWIALDEANATNGCLQFVDGSHRGPVHPHVAPPGQPFHLQVEARFLDGVAWSEAPVARGGVSFHHGGTIHRSGPNRSDTWRRAAAITYVTKGTRFDDPKLNYDPSLRVGIS